MKTHKYVRAVSWYKAGVYLTYTEHAVLETVSMQSHPSLLSHAIIRALRDISHVNAGKLPVNITVMDLTCTGYCLINSVC